MSRRGRLGPAMLIGAASVLNVAGGVVLKEAGALSGLFPILVGLSIAGLIALGQFVLWTRAHNQYPLSLTYPFTGLVFPLALAVSAMYGEPTNLGHVLATLLITAGVIVVHRSQEDTLERDA